MKVSKRQKEIIHKMLDGYLLMIGQSETTGMPYYLVTKGYDNHYFNYTVFKNLLEKKLIAEDYNTYDYVLTKLAYELFRG